MSNLAYKRTNVYEKADEKLMKEIFDYAEGYKAFLDVGKTERECCAYAKKMAIAKGYKPFKFGQKLCAVFVFWRRISTAPVSILNKYHSTKQKISLSQKRITTVVSVSINGRRFPLQFTALLPKRTVAWLR